ncbi:MAG: MFS transporter [Desulfatiglans sp.]|nr:MFS transporter [Desulfatiglans sp.]
MNQQSTAIPKTPAYAWGIVFALYMVTLSATLNLFKVPPLMVTLNKEFSVTFVETGDLMGIFSIMGFVLALPAGFILKKFGIKMTALISVAAVAIGPTIGALATTFLMLKVGRFIEGVGMGLIMVTAPLAISIWFPLQKTSLPTGIWATSVGIGNIVMLLIAPLIDASFGWKYVWWLCAGFSALSFIIFAIMFRMPRADEMAPAPAPPPGEDASPSLLQGMANRSFWMIGIAFGCYNLVVMAVTNVYPSFLMEFRNFLPTFDKGPLMYASFVTAFVFGFSIISSPIGGWISDTIGKRKIMIIIPFTLVTLTFLFPFKVEGNMIPLYTFVFGILHGPLAAVLLASVPEVAKKPQFIGIGMAIAIFVQNIGMFVAGILFPRIQEAYAATAGLQESWAIAGYWMIPFCVLGIIATLFVKVR